MNRSKAKKQIAKMKKELKRANREANRRVVFLFLFLALAVLLIGKRFAACIETTADIDNVRYYCCNSNKPGSN